MKRIFPVCGLALWSALNSQAAVASAPLILPDASTSRVEQPAPGNAHTYEGDVLSLNFQDIEVRTVLQILADFTRFNLVVSDSVEGNVTLNLQDVPWDQALDLVLKSKGLDKRWEGNVLLIAPADEIAAQARQALEARNLMADLAPLRPCGCACMIVARCLGHLALDGALAGVYVACSIYFNARAMLLSALKSRG